MLPHEPLKVLRGEPDEEDEQDELFRRFQPPPGTTTEEEQEDDNSDNDDDEDSFTTDADNTSDDGMGRDFDEHNANETTNAKPRVHFATNNDVIHCEDDALLTNDTAALLPNMYGASNC